MVQKRKLIEVALPLEAINRESAQERSRSGTVTRRPCTCGGHAARWRQRARFSSLSLSTTPPRDQMSFQLRRLRGSSASVSTG